MTARSVSSGVSVQAGEGAVASLLERTVWVVVPTYNEAENLVRLIPALEAELAGRPSRILVVDDASEDATAAVLDTFQGAYRNITIRRRAAKLGPGSALREGLMQALEDPCCDRICTIDADLSHDPYELNSLLAASDKVEFVQGSRYVRGGRVVDWPWHRWLLSRTANWFCSLLGSRHAENTTNYRVYGRAAAAVAVRASASKGFEWLVSAGLAIQRAGMASAEVPITFRERHKGRSKMSLPVAWRYIRFFLRALAANAIRRPAAAHAER